MNPVHSIVDLSAEELEQVSGGTFLAGHLVHSVLAIKAAKLGLGLAALHAVKEVAQVSVSLIGAKLLAKLKPFEHPSQCGPSH